MKNLLFLVLFCPLFLHAQVLEVNWTANFRKELNVTCDANDLFCETLCEATAQCVIPEGSCRDCIGTSVKMNYLISEIGNTILNNGHTSDKKMILEALKSNRFVTLTAQDVYNVIDAARSVRAFKKFENLCPGDSSNQILFLSSREIIKPEFVYCDYFEYTEFFGITNKVLVDVEFSLL
jgi:hypothetical protein